MIVVLNFGAILEEELQERLKKQLMKISWI